MTPITALNGRMPDSMLVVADTGANGPQRFRIDAAASWDRMLADGVVPAGCLRSGYRTLAEQAKQDPNLAAPVGKSQHGEGLAADVDEPARSGIARNGAAYGWHIGFVKNEPWHAEYNPNNDQHAIGDTHAVAIAQPPMESETTMLYLMINDGSGRYGAKNAAHFATYDGRTFVEIGTDDANAIANTNLAGRAFSNVSYATWEGYHTAATTVIDARRKG